MRCLRCNSDDLIQIGNLIYCRNCIKFGQERINNIPTSIPVKRSDKVIYASLDYALTKSQQVVSQKACEFINQNKNVVIDAVCGSGKTEIVYKSIISTLNKKQVVGFALPRKALAVEIYNRISKQIHHVECALVCGGHTQVLDSQLVVLTTHQLYRYYQHFDLLIIDEIDAFPFVNDATLHKMAIRSCRGNMILMSASIFKAPPSSFELLSLNKRYHGSPLPVPKLNKMTEIMMLIFMIIKAHHYTKQDQLLMIFCPSIKEVKKINRLLNFFSQSVGVSSHTENLEKVLEGYRNHEFHTLVTTTLLERGMTFKNVNVIVYHASHKVFNKSTLIQIAGRVGRSMDYSSGEVYFIDKRINGEMKQCQQVIQQKNSA